MTSPIFIITIDAEGDNIWSRQEKITTENARYLPRFQSLCEQFGFKPTYLVNYEMATDPNFQKFGRTVLRSDVAEIGLHVHPWNSPPLVESAYNTLHHIYLYELPDEMIHAKLNYLTKLLSDIFDIRPLSHRAGRWGFDERVARVLAELGYLVDCSVTPGVSHRWDKGAPDGQGGSDYFRFPTEPYFLDLNDIQRRGNSQLLEVPVTIKPNYHPIMQQFNHLVEERLIGKVFRRIFGPPYTWLRPNGKNIESMLILVDWAIQQRRPVLEFMLHSSELMPGGSYTFKTADQIERLYQHLRMLFECLASLRVSSMTLSAYRSYLIGSSRGIGSMAASHVSPIV